MTLNDRQVQARNLIMQQVQILLEELNTLDDKVSKLRKYNKEYEAANNTLRSNPDIGSEGYYQKRLSEQYHEIMTLKEELKKWKEFGKLKDRAKMKVEGDRDYYRMRMNEIAAHLDNAEKRSARLDEYIVLNTRQAQAYEDLQRQNADNVRQNALLKMKVDSLQEIIEAGIKGLRDEDARRQQRGYSW